MIALEAENIAGGLTRARELPTATVGELKRRAGVGAAAGCIPLRGHGDLLGESQSHRPPAERGSSGIGDADVYLEKGASRVGRCRRTGVGSQYWSAGKKAGQY